MIFAYLMSMTSPAVICRKSDFERIVKSETVEQMIDLYRTGHPGAKKHLPAFCFHASFPHGVRKSSDSVYSGLFLCDYDGMGKEQMRDFLDKIIPKAEEAVTSEILLVHITPSGEGLRIVAKATKEGEYAQCQSIADYQRVLSNKLGLTSWLDPVCTDAARMSFAPRHEDILYLSDRLFDEPAEVTDFAPSHAEVTPADVPQLVPGAVLPLPDDSDQSEYEGLPLKLIFENYIQQTGGMPQKGARNSRYYSAARDLRYICDFNPATIARYLPDCGLSASEVFQLCSSACQSVRAVRMSVAMEMALQSVRQSIQLEHEVESGEVDIQQENAGIDMSNLPLLAREFLRCCPLDFQEATLLSLLPIIGTLSTKVRARYIDGEIHSPSFFTTVTAEQASGKSFARRLVRQLLRSIEEEDQRQREIELKYKEQLSVRKNDKKQPEPPRVKVRIIPSSTSVAKLLQRMDYADGEHLFTFDEEMDTLLKTNRSGTWSEKFDLYRKAFDNTRYGQDYFTETSYSTNLPIFYNLLVLGTPRQTRRFFSDVENGLVSRCCFARIPDQFGSRLPSFKQISPSDQTRIEKSVEILRSANGMVDLTWLYPVINAWLENERIKALEENNRARDIFRRRSAVIGFRAVLAFSPLCDLQITKVRTMLGRFAVLVASITLENQLNFAGRKLNEIVSTGDESIQNMSASDSIFSCLASSFFATDVANELRKRNMRTPARMLIYKWTKNHLIEKQMDKSYKKIINGTYSR